MASAGLTTARTQKHSNSAGRRAAGEACCSAPLSAGSTPGRKSWYEECDQEGDVFMLRAGCPFIKFR